MLRSKMRTTDINFKVLSIDNVSICIGKIQLSHKHLTMSTIVALRTYLLVPLSGVQELAKTSTFSNVPNLAHLISLKEKQKTKT